MLKLTNDIASVTTFGQNKGRGTRDFASLKLPSEILI